MKYHEEACANHVDDITLSFQRKNGQCGEKPIFDIESPCHINSHWAPLQAWWSHLIAMISKNTILQISTPQGVTTVQYLTTSLQSLKLLGRTLGLKYNHKSLHKSLIPSRAIIQSILYQVHSSAGQRHICPRYSWQHVIREWNLVQNVASYDWSNIFLLAT